MTNLYFFVDYLNILFLFMAFVTSSSAKHNLDMFKNHYGEGYGTTWIYFPDGDGKLHYVNLRQTQVTGITSLIFSTSFYNNEDIQFRLYNKNVPLYILLDYQGRAIDDNKQEIVTQILHSNLPLKLITHGWRSSADNDFIIKNAYLQAQNVNIITVDWSGTAGCIVYLWSAYQTQYIGAEIASFLDSLNEAYNVIGYQLHLIGHSLGAHVMANAASNTHLRVHRVTGLDPARPYFEIPFVKASAERLDPTDAEIVDVIHTCAGLLGFTNTLGTVDFYPNEGSAPQPGCEKSVLRWIGACSHSKAFNYFIKSIKNPTKYPANKCASWEDFLDHRCHQTGYMGDSVNRNMTGTHYLTTKKSKTFHTLTGTENGRPIASVQQIFRNS